ncbi:hypothetical protein [Gimesia aquarii]|uniref:Uncharacterized protein n=1 Tax=Gimesia aquarii TaxID=2527964 RepID=A0A517VR99_9PLAN|nr:hypothetical protein [Gimesia aquarii]QDT95546.1 hypothetical protein V144x_09910 [Gimesia aquarii]
MAKNTPDTSKAEAENTSKNETLVEKTPLGLSEQQMKKSNPEAVQKIQSEAAEKAKSEAKAESDKALSEMESAFPDDLEFAIQAHKEGLSVEQAKAKRYDDVVKENQTLKEENATLKKDDEELKVNFAPANEPNDSKTNESKSESEIDNDAASVWNNMSVDEKAEFGNIKTSFFTYYKKHPEEFSQKK